MRYSYGIGNVGRPLKWTVNEFAENSLTIRWLRNNMKKTSIKNIQVVQKVITI